MTNMSTMKYQAVLFLLAHLCLPVLISPTLGSFDTVSEAICEYEDANLIWRNTPTYSFNDVKAMAWYKGKDSLIASWMEGKGFIEYAPYIGRLMQIGETGIKIMTAKRSDSGTYWLSLTLASADHKLEAATDLVVIVTPSSYCKPNLTREGSFLKADLPAGVCGTPHLTLKWKYNNKTIIQKIQNSSSVLYLEIRPEPAEYIVCAEGESAKCYQGNISDLCASYNITDDVQNPVSDHESGTLGTVIAVIALLVVVAISAIVAVMRCRNAVRCINPCLSLEAETLYRKSNDKLYFLAAGGNTGNETETEDMFSFEERKSSGEVLLGIQNHLKELYKSLMSVSLSPPGEEGYNVNVSNLYVNINVVKVECTDLNKGNIDTSLDVPHDSQHLISNDEGATKQINHFCPIIIFGDCGSGKSTWCKHIVNCWLHKADDKDANIQGLNLPDIRNIQILLYLPLQFSDRGLSLQELLIKYLFKEKAEYQEFLRKYVKHQPQDVLIIVDGLDIIKEYSQSISELLHDELLFSCNAIITSRPASFQLLQDTCHDKLEHMRVFRVREMDIETSKQFARELFKGVNRLHGKNFEEFWEFIEHLQVQSLLKVPYICLLMLHVWMKNKNPFIETTDILFHIITYYLRRAMTDQQRKELIEKVFGKNSTDVKTYITKLNQWPILSQNEHLLRVLSCVAAEIFFPKIETKNGIFKVPDRFSIASENYFQVQVLCETGLITESYFPSTNGKLSYLSFSDRIIFEFFVSIFIALQEGKECDFVVSSGSSCLQNSMIMHLVFELSNRDKVVIYIMDKARNNLVKESRNIMGNEGRKAWTNYCITQKSTHYDPEPLRWLQCLMYNDVLDEKKLLFLTPALYCIDRLTSLVLENHENDKNLVFRLPLLSTLEILMLDIHKCTLLLCKEWDYLVPRNLKDVVIKSVNINTGTLGLLMKVLCLCSDLERLELFPSENWTDDNYITPTTSGHANYSWNKLSKDIQNNKKLKTLKLQNLNLVGEVDTFLSHLNRYQNIEYVNLGNSRNIIQQESSELHSLDTTSKGNGDKPKDNIQLTYLELEKLNITHSPINFLFDTTKEHTKTLVKTHLKVLSLSELNMPDDSWKTFGNQISTLTITDLHLSCVNPRESLNILLEGIGKCTKLQSLSLCEMDTGTITPDFSFLAKLKEMLKLHMQRMSIKASCSGVLFKSISNCKKLHTLSFCCIDIEAAPETFSSVKNLKNLSELIVDQVTINEGSESLREFLDAFRLCKGLKIS